MDVGEAENQDESKVRQEYEAVCSKLNMDQSSMESAWLSYTNTRDYYALEGNHLEWLGCALYVAGQSLQLETVEGQAREGNSVSLTQILRATKLNLIEFFKKMKKWLEMACLPPSFQQKIEALERKFEVASIIYDKYRKVFGEMFELGEEKPSSAPTRARGRKPNHKKPCSSYEVFRFGWTLYIHIKSQYPQINDDLVNSHHLLLCCLDVLYSAAYTKRRELLHAQCPILQDNLDDLEELSVLPQICQLYNGIEKECRVIRDFFWNNRLWALFDEKVLSSGSGATRSQDTPPSLLLLSPGVFQANDKNLNREYERSVLEKGDFDERVFLHPSANEEIGTPVAVGAHNFRTSLAATTPPQHVQYGTPLLGRELLGARDQKMTPASEATHSVAQLHVLLEYCHPEPSDYVRRLCSSCMVDPLPNLEKVITELGEKLVKESPSDGTPTDEPSTFAKLRLHLSKSLYYKLLDAIMRDEDEKKNQDFGALQNILEYTLFHKSLFSLCVEIVLFSYNSQSRTFPWVLKVFGLSAYHFYKLIEVAIKLESFPRGIIKHLSRVEEMVLSQLAWESDSPLFDAIDAAGSVPPYKDVALPTVANIGRSVASPLVHPRVRKLGARIPESPLSALHDRHTSPGSTARRALFTPGGSIRQSPIPIAPKPSPQAKGGVTIQLLSNAHAAMKKQLQGGSPSKDVPHADAAEGEGSGWSPTKGPNQASEVTSTQMSPVNLPPSISQSPPGPAKSAPLTTTLSPPGASKSIPLGIIPEILTSPASTVLSPSKAPPTTPGSVRPLIPTSPPIPSVTVTQITPMRGQVVTTTPSGNATSPRPKRTGSLALFYRKMYQLAFIRIKDLCERLALAPDFTQKVWTCFEHSMMKSPDLLRDRHLDQIIMCNIYVLSKALGMEVTFQHIMRQYRHQPQAKSHMYRRVLLNNGPRRSPPPDTSSADTTSEQAEAPPTSPPAQQSTVTPLEELLYPADIDVGARGDIIQFYNKVFIGYIKDFVLQFSPRQSEANPSLSPLPIISKATPSPRKLSKHHNIYVSPHKTTPSSSNPSPLAKPIGRPFIIQRSPIGELRELNRAIKSTKRTIDLSATPSLSPAAKRLHLSPGAVSAASRTKPNSLLQAMNSVASDRAKSVPSND